MEWKFCGRRIVYVYECGECREPIRWEFDMDEDKIPRPKDLEKEECPQCGATPE